MSEQNVRMETFSYDDKIVRYFVWATLLWAVVGMLAGLWVALQLVLPELNFGLPWLTFGRLRPLHTNAVIFAFTANGLFAGIYYSTQRLLKARMFSDALSWMHFWGWQAIIVAAAVTLPLGITQSREYAELEWPIDIAIALVWVIFGVNFFGTIAKRRERHLYVAIWFHIATVITIAMLHIFNNLHIPSSFGKSYSIYAGVQDAFMQWWYGHNAVGFLLTTPVLGLMYYFMPKAANRPVYSYKLSILHFWSLIFIYIWAGPHHLHYTSLPAWASTLGMLFSVMLWMPSWGGMLNGLLTLRGAWHKLLEDPTLKFFAASVTFYGMATFEGPLLSVKLVNSLSHYTDWTIAHVHSGALGWVGFMLFGMIYWLLPRIFQTKKMWSKTLAETHFWIGTIGILLYIVPIYAAGLTQGLMWRDFDDSGRLAYPDFVETVMRLMPMYWVRVIGGSLYIVGTLMCCFNAIMTWRMRPASYEETVHQAPALTGEYVDEPDRSRLRESGAHVTNTAYAIERISSMQFHRRWERLPLLFSVWVGVAVVSATLMEALPTFLIKSNVPTIKTVEPYTPLEVLGRDIYVAEGCYNCHSQMVRPMRAETERYGEYSKAGEFIYDRPFQWGSRRIGPDLHRVGGRYSHLWHYRHFENPRDVVAQSIMPPYPWLIENDTDFEAVTSRIKVLAQLGAPYDEDTLARAPEIAREQAREIAAELVEQGGPAGTESKEVIALIAYLQRLGTDIFKVEGGDVAPEPPEAPEEVDVMATAEHESSGTR